MKNLLLAFVLVCSGCVCYASYTEFEPQQKKDQKKEPICDWKKAYEASKDKHKTVRLIVEIEVKDKSAEFTDIYLKDKDKEHYITSVAFYPVNKEKHAFVIFLGERLKNYSKHPSDDAVFVVKSKADVRLISAKVEIIDVK